MYRFVDKTRTMVVHEETGQVLEWNPVTDKIVSDHGFAGEAYRSAGSPQPLPPFVSAMPDDQARQEIRVDCEDRQGVIELHHVDIEPHCAGHYRTLRRSSVARRCARA